MTRSRKLCYTSRMPSTKRFVLHDRGAAQDSRLARWSATNPRYEILDTEYKEHGTDRVYDMFTTKRPAADTVRDLNKGLYGPLAESQS